ncbi:AAA family ATPase [Streptomyces sp. NPDC020141]|uniref:helix-turn-helix transcriptional regulator n=1 Tax=Streptomyces sp. NPDC020141 TaxID=3365065 RepID=UPI00379EDD64
MTPLVDSLTSHAVHDSPAPAPDRPAVPLLAEHGHVRAALEQALDQGARGTGSSLLITGPAGTGRTILLDDAATAARQRGFTVLHVRCSYADRETPLELPQRLTQSACRLGAQRLWFPIARQAADLLRGLPAEGVPRAAAPRGLYGVLGRLAAPEAAGPLLVAVDDVQWADEDSLRWLVGLAERCRDTPLTLLLSLCPGTEEHGAGLLADLTLTQSRELPLRDLGRTSVAAVLEHHLGVGPEEEFTDACLAATGGNLHLVASLAARLAQLGHGCDARAASALPGIVVDSIARSFDGQLRRLSPYAPHVVGALVVLDSPATPARIAELTGLGRSVVASIAERLVRLGVLTPGPAGVTVRHPVLATAVRAALAPGEAEALHGRAARLLHRAEAAPDAVARHLARALPSGEPWVLEALRAGAADRTAAGDPDAACGHLRRALAEPLAPEPRAALLLELAEAASRTDLAEAAAALDEAIRLSPDARRAVRRTPGLLDLLLLSAPPEQAEQTALALAGPQPRDADPALALRLYHCGVRGPLPSPSVSPAAGGDTDRHGNTDDGGGPDDGGVFAGALTALTRLRRHGESAAAFAEAHKAARSEFPSTPAHVMSHLWAAEVMIHTGRPDAAAALLEAALIRTRRWRHRPLEALARSLRSLRLLAAEGPAAALDDARAAVATLHACAAAPSGPLATLVRARLVHLLTLAGRCEEAGAELERAGVPDGPPVGLAGATHLFARGELKTTLGYTEDGVRDLLECGRRLREHGLAGVLLPWRSSAARALLEAGRDGQARELALAEAEEARAHHAPGILGLALSAAARTAGGTAPEVMDEAVDLLRAHGAPHELARVLTDQGVLLHRAGRTPAARAALREAVHLAQDIGAAPVLERAAAELTAAGGRMPRSRRKGLDSLTAAERKVAALAAGGHTNREISKFLFVQLRTVEIHLTNTYRKLGIESRDQLRQSCRPSPGLPGRTTEGRTEESSPGP